MVGMIGKIKSKSWQCTELGETIFTLYTLRYIMHRSPSLCGAPVPVYSGQEEMSVPHAAQCKYVCIAAP